MSFRRVVVACLFVLVSHSVWAQLPPDRKLSAEDQRELNAQLARLKNLLPTANDKAAIELQIANWYSVAGQYDEATRLLRKLVNADLGFDPYRDPDFAVLRHTREFQAILEEVHRQTPPISNSHRITTINEPDFSPENLAFESAGQTFLFGSTTQNRIVRFSSDGRCATLVTPRSGEHGYVLGLKIDKVPGSVWAATNTQAGASVREYSIKTGQVERMAQIELRRIVPEHRFRAANGIAISSDDGLLYVSTWGDGVDVIDLRTGLVEPIRHPDDVCLAFIDGLYWVNGNLVAIQNGPMLPRIVRLKLDQRGKRVVAMTILERRNPLFDGLTTGVIVGKQLYYIANPKTDQKSSAKLDPLQILAVQVVR